ncbi:MAG: FixH family protein [Pseudomonadota bacterium]
MARSSTYFVLYWLFSCSLVAAEPAQLRFEGQTRFFSVVVESQLKPIVINQMHAWSVRLTWPDGLPIEDAVIDVAGGMPAHNHGLPSSPRVTEYLGDGTYLIEGMKFHMPGKWRLVLTVKAQGKVDNISIPISV